MANCKDAPPPRNMTLYPSGIFNISFHNASVSSITACHSFERWDTSMTDIPVPLKSFNASIAALIASFGRTHGPALKLCTRFISIFFIVNFYNNYFFAFI